MQNGMTANTYNAGMCLSGNHTEIAQMVERPCSNGKVSGSIPGSVAFLNFDLKNYSYFTPVSLWKIVLLTLQIYKDSNIIEKIFKTQRLSNRRMFFSPLKFGDFSNECIIFIPEHGFEWHYKNDENYFSSHRASIQT